MPRAQNWQQQRGQHLVACTVCPPVGKGHSISPRLPSPNEVIACATKLIDVEPYDYLDPDHAPNGLAGYYRRADAPPPCPLLQAQAILHQAARAGAPFVACADHLGEIAHYDWRADGPDGPGYYRNAAAPESSDPREASLCVLREAAAAGAEFVRCAEPAGEVRGYDFGDGPDGVGYYRRADAPLADGREYSRMVLQRASAAGALFVACPEEVMQLPGYDFRVGGEEGTGYYRRDDAAPPHPPPEPAGGRWMAARAPAAATDGYDDFMASMRELGALG